MLLGGGVGGRVEVLYELVLLCRVFFAPLLCMFVTIFYVVLVFLAWLPLFISSFSLCVLSLSRSLAFLCTSNIPAGLADLSHWRRHCVRVAAARAAVRIGRL